MGCHRPMANSFLDYLDARDLPVPLDRPFLRAEAMDRGLTSHALRVLLRRGLLISPLSGVYYAPTLSDDLTLRLACLRLVMPEDGVVCDRTAGWLHGAPRILAPGSHLEVPRVSVFLPETGRRLRNVLSDSGSRQLTDSDVVEVGGIPVTTPLRTACDLGRLLHRDQALAALDSLLRLGHFSRERLIVEVVRFRGMRNVTRLRELAPLADGRAESPGESILRLRWLDCTDLPRPDLQVEVDGPWGVYRLDLAVEGLGFGAEYDGVEWHGPDQEAHDEERRGNMRDSLGWQIEVFMGVDIHGAAQCADVRLRRALLPLLTRGALSPRAG